MSSTTGAFVQVAEVSGLCVTGLSDDFQRLKTSAK